MEIWIYALLTWALVVFITSYAKSAFSWAKTKRNWTTNHKATMVSMSVSLSLTIISVLNGGFSVVAVISIVGISAVSEVFLNRGVASVSTK